jgi:putative DNA-invertase from lambdoid prophage Rac
MEDALMDAIYFRVSSDRQTAENQFTDLLEVAERDDSGRDWAEIRQKLSACIYEEERPTAKGIPRIQYRVRPEVVEQLAKEYIYIEQARSGKVGAKPRPLFEQMKQAAALRKFDRLLVWKVTRLGRDMRQVVDSVYELSDLGVVVTPVKSATGPITSMLGKLLWSVAAWFAEMENDERSQTIKAGQARARAEGKHLGRPPQILDRVGLCRMRMEGRSWSQIALSTGVSVRTARRIYEQMAALLGPGKSLEDDSYAKPAP